MIFWREINNADEIVFKKYIYFVPGASTNNSAPGPPTHLNPGLPGINDDWQISLEVRGWFEVIAISKFAYSRLFYKCIFNPGL